MFFVVRVLETIHTAPPSELSSPSPCDGSGCPLDSALTGYITENLTVSVTIRDSAHSRFDSKIIRIIIRVMSLTYCYRSYVPFDGQMVSVQFEFRVESTLVDPGSQILY